MPRTLQRLALAGALLLLAGGVRTHARGEVASAAPTAVDHLREPLCRLLQELAARQLLPPGDDLQRQQALESLLNAFAPGATIVYPNGEGARQAALLDAVVPVNGRFGYIRVAAVESGIVQALDGARSRLPGTVQAGYILDVRGRGGNGIADAQAAAETLKAWERPLVVLVDGRTRGGAEALAGSLRRACDAVLVGDATQGLPYPFSPVPLPGGLTVLLPDVPNEGRASPLEPDVPVPHGGAHPGVAAGVRQGFGSGFEGTSIGSDLCVRKALDLLAAICAFREKHF
ncbi:MAG: hypothetical protein JXR77_01195 [Lentisphaeria bacterium]|nr:hypothetical protein [Lentisphaeria bacterium]